MDVGVEVLNITETPSGAVFLVNDFGLGEDQAGELLAAFYTLAFAQLSQDLHSATGVIEISPDPEFKNFITVIRGILVNGGFQLLVYFGGLANPETTLKEGLLHIAEVLATVREKTLDV